MTWWTRASADFARSQTRAASPPMLWQISTGGSAGGQGQAPDGVFDDGRIVLDGAEYRLEVDGDERMAGCAQPLEPWIPETAVADEAVDEYGAAPAPLHIADFQLVWHEPPAKRLAPAKHARRHDRFAQPGARQFRPGGLGHGVATADETQCHELDRQEQRVAQDDGRKTCKRQQRRICARTRPTRPRLPTTTRR